MNIALIAVEARTALCRKLQVTKKKIYCIPGNAGTSEIATNLNIDYLNFQLLLKNLKKNKINLVVVGPEEPLVKGIVNFLEKNNIKVFGPNKYASKLEGSKSFMKKICRKYNIPTAKFKICKRILEFKKSIKIFNFPVVVKADGLTTGKGVVICKHKSKAIRY